MNRDSSGYFRRFMRLHKLHMHPNRLLITKFLVLGIFACLGGGVVRMAIAGTYQGPTAAPPGGNIPLTIWNRTASSITQTNAAIAIDGGGPAGVAPVGISVGTNTLNMGVATAGENLFYGVADYSSMHPDDRLINTQVAVGGTYYDRFFVDRSGSGYLSGSLALDNVLSAGTAVTDLGNVSGGNYLIRAQAQYEKMNDEDYLLQVRTYSSGLAAFKPGLTVNRDGDLNTEGAVHADGCIGKLFVGFTYSGGPSGNGVFQADVGSYFAANAKCDTDYPGAHVCRSEEILESIACSESTDPIRNPSVSGTFAWIQGGPPGYSAMANDCVGWTVSHDTAYGRAWNFNTVTGGYGTQTTCNTPGLQFACCR